VTAKEGIGQKNIFPSFHYGHANFLIYITKYHSSPTQEFIVFEKSYSAPCRKN